MTVLKNLPELAVIRGFKGILDFYVWMGLPVVRRWPRSPGTRRTPEVEAQWSAWRYASQNWQSLSPRVQEAYRLTASGLDWSGRDLFMKSYLMDYFREGQWSPYDEPIDKDSHFTVIDIQWYVTLTGYLFHVTTDIPCHLYFYWTDKEPEKHPYTVLIRGQPLSGRARFCFVTWHQNSQIEPGNTITHTFYKPNWPICQTRYITFRASIGGFWCKSSTAIFSLHRTYADIHLLLTETWDWYYIPCPDFSTLVLFEPWAV